MAGPDPPFCLCELDDRLDEAATALQKEKNMYKDIENYPTCFKVRSYVICICILLELYPIWYFPSISLSSYVWCNGIGGGVKYRSLNVDLGLFS